MEARETENTMNAPRTFLLVAVVVLCCCISAFGGDVKIIANPSVRADSITVAELRGVFLEDRRTLNDGSHVEPVLAKSGAAHDAFLREYVGKSDNELRTYYRTLVFTGTGVMPKFLDSDAEIVNYVARTRGAIAYVSIDSPTGAVKVLAISQAATRAERQLITRIEPDYPEALRSRGIGGAVRLRLTISPKGSVETVVVLGGNPILADCAAKAAKQWIYAPWPSRTTAEVSIPFNARP
jgi:TonB family protein